MNSRKGSRIEVIQKLEYSQNNDNDPDYEHDGDLPTDLQYQILIFLPLRSIFKFKLVSRRWNSLISSPFFIKSYIVKHQLDSSNLLSWTLVSHRADRTINHVVSSKVLNPLTISKCTFSLPKRKPYLGNCNGGYRVLSSSNGLLLCGLDESNVYAICNPLTREWYDVPKQEDSCGCGWRSEPAFVTEVEAGVDGLCLKVVNYKVIRLHNCVHATSTLACVVLVYDSNIKRWTESILDVSLLIEKDRRPVSLNNIIHWECSHGDIIAYHPYDHTGSRCRLIEAPDNSNIAPLLFGVCSGRLQYLNLCSGVFHLWVLVDYDEGKWELKHKIGSDEFRILTGCLMYYYLWSLAFHPFDSDIMIIFNSDLPRKLMLYDMRTREVVYSCPGLSRSCNSHQVFPFVHRVWPTTMDHSIACTTN